MTQRPPHAPSSPEHKDDDEGISAEVRKTLTELSPWAISVAVHLLLVVAAVFLVWSTVLQQEEEPWSGAVSINDAPDIKWVESETQQTEEEASRTPTSPIIPNDPMPTPIMRNPGTNQPFVPVPDLRPGPPNPDGLTDGPGGGPPPGLLGPTGRQTVFVIDASGSLIDTFPLVINELKRLLSQLAVAERERLADPARRNEPAFAYSVVFFRDGEVLVQDRRGLRIAEADAVARSVAWLDQVSPGGSTSPLPAIEQALDYRPDTVIVLLDNITGHGQFELNADDLVSRVMQVRGDRPITINTVQFLYPDPLAAYGQMGTLERLAVETDGAYRFISDKELNLR